jgi:hypothetical protein
MLLSGLTGWLRICVRAVHDAESLEASIDQIPTPNALLGIM